MTRLANSPMNGILAIGQSKSNIIRLENNKRHAGGRAISGSF